jgi:hypothetical protein
MTRSDLQELEDYIEQRLREVKLPKRTSKHRLVALGYYTGISDLILALLRRSPG